jgi:hypothetical protein
MLLTKSDDSNASVPLRGAIDPIEPFEYWENSGRGRRLLRPILRGFQHSILPRAQFSRDPVLLETLSRPEPTAYDFFNLMNRSAMEYGRLKGWSNDFYKQDAFVDYVEALVQYIVGEQHSVDGISAWVIKMPLTVAPAEAQLAVLWNFDIHHASSGAPSPSLYFTLERNTDQDYSLIKRTATGQRINLGNMPFVDGYELVAKISSEFIVGQ